MKKCQKLIFNTYCKKEKRKKKEMLRVFKFLTYAKKFMMLITVSLKW